ncbi:MAG: TonB-dependent receptor domain-containing protein [Candidatus Limimorpha sp.]
MRRAIFIILFLFSVNLLFSQNTISGVLSDSISGERLMFVNVGLVRASDSVFVSGAASDDKGRFKLEHVPDGSFIMQVSAIGYQTYKRFLDVNTDLDLGVLKICQGTTTLDEIVIVDKKPLFANEGEKTLYNVSEDPTIQTGTASDALQNAPGVEVDVEGNITLRGVSSVDIWINGKPSHLNEENLKTYIQQLPANAIKTIEVITNPSARYANKGDGGIINIVTNSKVQKNQFISFGANASSRPNVSPWLSYVYANEKISFNMYLNGNYRKNSGKSDGYTYSFHDNEYSSLDTTTTTRYNGNDDSNGYGCGLFMNFQYNIDTMNNVSVWVGGFPNWSEKNSFMDYYRDEYLNNAIDQRIHYQTVSTGSGLFAGMNGGVTYQHLFNNEGHNITVSLDGSYYGGHDNSSNTRTYLLPNGDVERLLGYQTANRFSDFGYSANVDYNIPYIKNGEIAVGAYYNHAPDTYHIDYDTLSQVDVYTMDTMRTFDRRSWEDESGVYITLQHKFGNFVVKPGVRFERNEVNCEMVGYMSDYQKKTYFNIRPSLHISYRTKSMHNFKLSYSRRVSNPDARYLTSFVEYEEESVSFGNPELHSVFTNSFDGGWTKYFEKFGSVGLSAYYRNSEGTINTVTDNYYDDLLFNRWIKMTKPYNVGKSYNAGFEANVMYRPNGFFNMRLYANVYDSYYKTEYNGKVVESEMWSYSLRLNVWTKLWNKLEVHASGNYRSATQSLYAERRPSYSINCGLRSDFFDKKMSVFLNVNDIFNWNKWDNNTNNPYYISYNSYKNNSRFISLGVTFRFGKMELERHAQQGGESEGMDMQGGKK